MTEAAEIKLSSEYLNSVLENKIITDWSFTNGQYEHKYPTGFDEFHDALPLLVEEVRCKGKLIYICCFNEFKKFYILHNMRISGRWQEKPDIYCRWYIEIENKKKIWFYNMQCLSTLYFTTDEDEFNSLITKIGPDILSEEFTLDTWKKLVKQHGTKNITSFLTDQRIISGCGNYLKSECLFYAHISPMRNVDTLTENESEKLFEALRIIPRIAYNYKGLNTTDPHGKKGFQEFNLKIYNQPHAKRTKTSDGRITFWNPNVQK